MGWGWLDMEDPWTHRTMTMKPPLEEIKWRQRYQTSPKLSGGEVQVRKDMRMYEPKGVEAQLEGAEPLGWTVYIYLKDKGPWRRGACPGLGPSSVKMSKGERARHPCCKTLCMGSGEHPSDLERSARFPF